MVKYVQNLDITKNMNSVVLAKANTNDNTKPMIMSVCHILLDFFPIVAILNPGIMNRMSLDLILFNISDRFHFEDRQG